MTVGIKYCGGCNSTFDRSEVVRLLARELDDIQVVYSGLNDVKVDLLVVICGCSARCVTLEPGAEKMELFILSGRVQYEELKARLRVLKEE